MTTQQPEALRLAESYEATGLRGHLVVAAELRSQHARIVELEAQLAAAQPEAQWMDMVNCKSGNWLTVVYRDIRPGDEARTIGEHPKVSALSWSHALNDRDAALAAQAKQGEQQ